MHPHSRCREASRRGIERTPNPIGCGFIGGPVTGAGNAAQLPHDLSAGREQATGYIDVKMLNASLGATYS